MIGGDIMVRGIEIEDVKINRGIHIYTFPNLVRIQLSLDRWYVHTDGECPDVVHIYPKEK